MGSLSLFFRFFLLCPPPCPSPQDPAIRRRFEKRVYIPLPDPRARYVMFKQNIGSTTNDLTEQDLQLLAAETEGFSGSDISVLVRDALYEPVRIAQIVTCSSNSHFLFEFVGQQGEESKRAVAAGELAASSRRGIFGANNVNTRTNIGSKCNETSSKDAAECVLRK
jgi:hypothetical protein